MSVLKKYLNIFLLAVASGMCICIGGGVYLVCPNKLLGAFLFSVGLCTILVFRFNLFTGMVGYIPQNKPIYITEVAVVWLGNMCGAYTFAYIMGLSRIGDSIRAAASTVVEVKLADNMLSLVCLGIFCGLLMFIAVDSYKKNIETKPILAVFMAVMCVAVFIFAGFEHSIADMYYFAAAGRYFDGMGVILTVTLGNAIGGMIIPLIQKLSSCLTKSQS